MILTLKELAEHLRLNERTILRMLQNGQIEGAKIGGQWRFNSTQIDQIFFPEKAEEGSAMRAADLLPAHIRMPASRALRDSRMVLDMTAETVEEALTELSQPLVRESLLPDTRVLRERLLAREKLLSTGVGRGVAIPHPRDPIATLREPAVLVVGCSRTGIDFRAADREPVTLFFLLCCQNIQSHLVMMARLADILRHPEFLEECRTAATPRDVTRAVLKAERDEFFTA